ncbi:unnamed protein product, partial [Ectocarpus fasciculatus]
MTRRDARPLHVETKPRSRYRAPAAVSLQFVKGDICSSDMVTYVLREEKIDTILHFAAQTH